MTLKSTKVRYGAVAVTIHWVSAFLVLALLGSEFRAANTLGAAAKAEILQFHIPVAIFVLLLTLFRIAWWWFLDRKPDGVPDQPRWQERVAGATHVAFYIVILLMVASGIGMIVMSGAGPLIFGGNVTRLPDFSTYPPRLAHGMGGRLLVALFLFHAGAALYHQFVRRDGLLSRMWFGH